jgi:F-type H+-transporting ATPase subunit a
VIAAMSRAPHAVAVGVVHVTDSVTLKIFGLSIDVNDLWSMLLACVLVVGFGLYVARRATAGVPSRGQLFWEMVVDAVASQVGEEARPVIPLAVTFFVFILTCNWLELFYWSGHDPSYLPTPTSNINLDYMMALVVFVVTNYVAIKHAGLRTYLGHFFKPNPLFFPIELVNEIAKPLTLALRLFGNVFTGALVFALLSGLFSHFYPPIFLLDLIWLPFDLFVFLIQAFIFALLTIIYYQQALDMAHGGH